MRETLGSNWKYYRAYGLATVMVINVSLYGYFSKNSLSLTVALVYSALFWLCVIYVTVKTVKRYKIMWLVALSGNLVAIALPAWFIVSGVVYFVEAIQKVF